MSTTTLAWTVPGDHPVFAGHFPGRPIVPGVVLIDRAILLASRLLNRSAITCRIANAKFFSPVGPGETLAFTLTAKAGGSLQCDIRCGERAVAAATLSFAAGATP